MWVRLLTNVIFKQRLKPTMYDHNTNEVGIDFEEAQSSNLDEMQKFINQCLNLTESCAESSNSEDSGSGNYDSENSDSD